MDYIKLIKDATKKIAKQVADQNFFGSYPSLNDEFIESYGVIIDYSELKGTIDAFYNKVLFINSAENIRDIIKKSVVIDDFDLPRLIDEFYNEIVNESTNESLQKDFPDFYVKNKDSDKYDRDILDYIYVLTLPDNEGRADALSSIEDIKTKALMSDIVYQPLGNNNKSHNLMQHMISMCCLVPSGSSQDISEISKKWFGVATKSIDDLIKKLEYSCLLLNKIQKNNYEYTIWNLTDPEYIKDNNLEDDPRNGVNKINIKRLETIRAINPSTDQNPYDFSIKFIEGKDKDQPVFVLDTHDGATYRLLRKYGRDLTISSEEARKILDPRTSSPIRLEVYNNIINSVIQSKVVQPPLLQLAAGEKIVWNNVNDKLANQIVAYFREYTKGKGMDYKILKNAIEDNEFVAVITESLISFVKIREVESNEVMLTIEFELHSNMKILRDKMLYFIKSKKQKMKDYDKEKMLSFMSSDLLYVLGQVFNSQANIFNSIMQKFMILKHFKG